MSVLFISKTNYSHTREFHSDRNGWKSRNVEAEAFGQDVHALVLRAHVAHDFLNDGTALESSSLY